MWVFKWWIDNLPYIVHTGTAVVFMLPAIGLVLFPCSSNILAIYCLYNNTKHPEEQSLLDLASSDLTLPGETGLVSRAPQTYAFIFFKIRFLSPFNTVNSRTLTYALQACFPWVGIMGEPLMNTNSRAVLFIQLAELWLVSDRALPQMEITYILQLKYCIMCEGCSACSSLKTNKLLNNDSCAGLRMAGFLGGLFFGQHTVWESRITGFAMPGKTIGLSI